MKKRVFVVFLVIIIFSGFLFGCSGAGNMVGTSGINDPDDPSSNPDAHIHDGVEYTPISVSDLDCINGDEYSIYYKILENGHYYLTEDM